jgi:phosphoribosylglycinamide formyltransferase-1
VARPRITVLVSGRGSNLASLLDAQERGTLAGDITHVISNRPAAAALDVARAHGIAATAIDHLQFAKRSDFDAALAAAIDADAPDLVVMAGFMRVMGAPFVRRYAGRMINIHPSLLPAYPGLQTHRRALADGVREHGCTVHFVSVDVDAGAIIAQQAVPVEAGDDKHRLAARVLAAEHALLPLAVNRYCRGELKVMIEAIRTAATGAQPATAVAPLTAAETPGLRDVSRAPK